jgi:uncharacterized membrane protein
MKAKQLSLGGMMLLILAIGLILGMIAQQRWALRTEARIRAEYDGRRRQEADTFRIIRDKLRQAYLADTSKCNDTIMELIAQRDEARAEVRRLGGVVKVREGELVADAPPKFVPINPNVTTPPPKP